MTTATAVGDVEMRIAKVVGLATDEEQSQCVVLEEVAGDRQLAMAARLGGITWRRPMTYQFVAARQRACGGRWPLAPMTVGTVELSGSAALECGGVISIAS
jgi:hypothetical protein